MRILKSKLETFRRSKTAPKWLTWMALNLVAAAYLLFALVAPASNAKTVWLPGKTTHGHYQIELDCDACHAPATSESDHDKNDVMQDACLRCHGGQLKAANDTHPAKKFNDPVNAERLQILDAQNCLTCHQEHVPEQTLAMGLTLPADYCWHCHEDVADSRPSHKNMAYDTCATAGCHNYHDNRALYEKFLDDHYGQPDMLEPARVPPRATAAVLSDSEWPREALSFEQADHTLATTDDPKLLRDWAETAHAAAGVNCTHCHGGDDSETPWDDSVALSRCERCHADQVESFQTGKHGMRLAAGFSPMTPSMARLPMHAGAAHRALTCNACHPGHRFDTRYAASEACLNCHNDDHSLAYRESGHATLWRNESARSEPSGTGVSCATCHLPRLEGDSGVWVNHDQNANLRPNETMAREVCGHCHGLEFSLSSLADPQSIADCFSSAPKTRTRSVEMAHDWFAKKSAAHKRPNESR